jgi:DNA-binding cell septation regulator SpoVG
VIKVLEIERQNHHRIKALATVEVEGLGRVHGIKIISGNYGLYCHVPDVKLQDKSGDSVFKSLIVFERSLWDEIKRKTLMKYAEKFIEEVKDEEKYTRGKKEVF